MGDNLLIIFSSQFLDYCRVLDKCHMITIYLLPVTMHVEFA